MSKFKPKTTTGVFNQDADTSLEAVDAKLYGNVDLVPNSERIVAKNVDIMTIRADIEQPRRAIPLRIRGDWGGHPEQVVPLLEVWQAAAEESIQQKLNATKMLKGLGDSIDYKDAEGKPLPLPPMAATFVNLLQLGASIHKDKLINPITISRRKEMFLIETGERRWLAHHLLNHFVSPKYGKIKATEVDRDVWRQAAENNNRDSLNAIQLARQLALLVMDMYKGDKDVHFDAIETLTFEGCDRRYYAQVANGYVWKIKDGFAERVQAAMGLSSYRMVSAYRKLLRYSEDEKLNDEIWIKADSENWSERAIRGYFEPESDDESLPMGKHQDESMFPTGNIDNDENTLPTGKVTDDSTPDKSGWASSAWVGKLAYSGPVKVFVKAAETASTIIVTTEDGEDHDVNVSSLREYTEPASKPLPGNLTAKAVQTVTGLVALVLTDGNGYVRLRFPDDTTAQMKKEFVSQVDMSEWYAAVRRHNEAKAAGNNGMTTDTTPPASTPATIPTFAVDDSVYLDDSKVIGKIVKLDGDTAHIQLSTGVWHYKLNRLTKANRQSTSSATTVTEAVEAESDDFTPEPEVQDFTPFDADNLAILNTLTEIADVLDVQEADILGDLCKLDRTRLERVLSLPDEGMAEVNKWTDIYRTAANTVIFAAMQRVEDHLASITELAQKITKAE